MVALRGAETRSRASSPRSCVRANQPDTRAAVRPRDQPRADGGVACERRGGLDESPTPWRVSCAPSAPRPGDRRRSAIRVRAGGTSGAGVGVVPAMSRSALSGCASLVGQAPALENRPTSRPWAVEASVPSARPDSMVHALWRTHKRCIRTHLTPSAILGDPTGTSAADPRRRAGLLPQSARPYRYAYLATASVRRGSTQPGRGKWHV